MARLPLKYRASFEMSFSKMLKFDVHRPHLEILFHIFRLFLFFRFPLSQVINVMQDLLLFKNFPIICSYFLPFKMSECEVDSLLLSHVQNSKGHS